MAPYRSDRPDAPDERGDADPPSERAEGGATLPEPRPPDDGRPPIRWEEVATPPTWDRPDPSPAPAPGRPLRLPELLDATFALYRRDPRVMLLISLTQLPLLIATGIGSTAIAIRLAPTAAGGTMTANVVLPLAGLALLVTALSAVSASIAGAAFAVAAHRRYADRERPSARAVLAAVIRRLGTIALAVTVVVLVQVGLMLIAVAGVVIAVVTSVAAGGGPGAFALLVVTAGSLLAQVFLGVRWALWPQAAMLEGQQGLAALGRSWRLVSGSTWRVFAYSIVFAILTALVTLLVSTFASIVVGDPLADPTPARVGVDALLSALASVLVAPVTGIGMTVLYHDLRRRRGERVPPSADRSG
jgi:hypothetical protein